MGGQKKTRFNMVDVLFLLVVLVGVLFIVLRTAGRETAKELPGEYYAVTYIGEAVPSYMLDLLEMGADVTDDEMIFSLGTVVDIQRGPSVFYNVDSSGNMVKSSRDDYESLLLTCRVEGVDNGFGITADGLALGVGHSIVLRADKAKISMMVYDIQKLSDTSYPLPEA